MPITAHPDNQELEYILSNFDEIINNYQNANLPEDLFQRILSGIFIGYIISGETLKNVPEENKYMELLNLLIYAGLAGVAVTIHNENKETHGGSPYKDLAERLTYVCSSIHPEWSTLLELCSVTSKVMLNKAKSILTQYNKYEILIGLSCLINLLLTSTILDKADNKDAIIELMLVFGASVGLAIAFLRDLGLSFKQQQE